MKTIFASGLLHVTKIIATWTMDDPDDDKPVGNAQEHANAFSTYLPLLTELGISGARASLTKIIGQLRKENCTYRDLKDLSQEAVGRLIDETSDKTFFALSPRETEIFKNPRRGWELAIERFPDIGDDVEEASKCYALSRYSAAVFHSLQIVEAGLIELGAFLKVNDPRSGWTAISHALDAVLRKKLQERSKFERRNHAFLEQMQGLVQGLKNAWRNKISHAHGRLVLMSKEFSPEIAEEILLASRALMRRLAEELPPPKPKKSEKK